MPIEINATTTLNKKEGNYKIYIIHFIGCDAHGNDWIMPIEQEDNLGVIHSCVLNNKSSDNSNENTSSMVSD